MQNGSKIFFKESSMSKEWPVLSTNDSIAAEVDGRSNKLRPWQEIGAATHIRFLPSMSVLADELRHKSGTIRSQSGRGLLLALQQRLKAQVVAQVPDWIDVENPTHGLVPHSPHWM